MADLMGSVVGHRGEASRLGTKKSGIRSTLQTWNASITTRLDADGSCTVEVRDLKGDGRSQVVWEGNIDGETRPAPSADAIAEAHQ